jgi:hypothetical protein
MSVQFFQQLETAIAVGVMTQCEVFFFFVRDPQQFAPQTGPHTA